MTQDNRPALDMKFPFWGIIIALLGMVGAYFGQKEATSIAMTEIKGSVMLMTSKIAGLEASITRIEVDKYTASDSRRDQAWRDERTVELAKRVTELELSRRRR